MLLAGHIEQEQVHEMKPKYESMLKIYQTALQKDVEHLPILTETNGKGSPHKTSAS